MERSVGYPSDPRAKYVRDKVFAFAPSFRYPLDKQRRKWKSVRGEHHPTRLTRSFRCWRASEPGHGKQVPTSSRSPPRPFTPPGREPPPRRARSRARVWRRALKAEKRAGPGQSRARPALSDPTRPLGALQRANTHTWPINGCACGRVRARSEAILLTQPGIRADNRFPAGSIPPQPLTRRAPE